jgi:hypothetical protein
MSFTAGYVLPFSKTTGGMLSCFQATDTGQLNTIMTFYEITDPQIASPLSGIPVSLLKKAISILSRSGRAQTISIADGEGVRFFAGGR